MELQDILSKLETREEDWRREALNMYDQGAFDREVMRELDLQPDEWRVLFGDPSYNDFRELVTVGRAYSAAWWEMQGRKNIHNPKFNTTLYKSMMSNHFGWSDKSETSTTRLDFSNMSNDDLVRTVKELSEKLKPAETLGSTAIDG